jgi:hypothetical protein
MATEFAVINFRVTPQERQRLRVMLLEEGQTVQAFFDRLVKEKLSRKAGIPKPFTHQESQSNERLAGSAARS